MDPRANQKARTRQALVDAAAELVAEGEQPTVPEAAERARVSRATAYRYFPTQDALLLEVSDLTPTFAYVERALDAMTGDDVEARLVALLDAFNPSALEHETLMRTALRVYLDTWFETRRSGSDVAIREGRRMRWLDATLEPLRSELSPAEWDRLRFALALTLGAEPMIVMKDVCHVTDDEEIAATLEWVATTILRGALADRTG